MVTHIELDPGHRPVWSGISQERIQAIQDAVLAGNGTEVEEAIANLHTATKLSLYVELPETFAPDQRKYLNVARVAFFAAAHLGSFWHYRLAYEAYAPGSFRTAQDPFNKSPVPRWLVTHWRVKLIGNVPVLAVPVQWKPYKPVPGGVYPDDETHALDLLLGPTRDERGELVDGEPPVDTQESGARSGEYGNSTDDIGSAEFEDPEV